MCDLNLSQLGLLKKKFCCLNFDIFEVIWYAAPKIYVKPKKLAMISIRSLKKHMKEVNKQYGK